MRRICTTALALTAAAALVAAIPAATAAPRGPDAGFRSAHVVTTFEPGAGGAFADGMAADGHGNLIVAVTAWGFPLADGSWTDNTGQLYRVRADGRTVTFGPAIPLGGCAALMGVAVDPQGRTFVAVDNYGPDPSCTTYSPPSGLLRVTSSSVYQHLTLPAGSWPNGVVARDGQLYVTDSSLGAVWRASASHSSALKTPWFSADLLAPPEPGSIGANGIAFSGGALYVTAYSRGLLVRIGLDRRGAPTHAAVVSADPRLQQADKLAFDASGRAWVVVTGTLQTDGSFDSGSLLVVGRDGHVITLATPAGALDYPTQPLLDDFGNVYICNGSYNNGTPSVVRLNH